MNNSLIMSSERRAVRIILALMLMIYTLAFSGCKQVREEPPKSMPEVTLENTAWTLIAFLEGQSAIPVTAGTEITLRFDARRASGSAGCNQYGGEYSLERGSLSIYEIDITDRLCMEPEGVMEQEARYLMILQKLVTFELDANQLTLTTADGDELRFSYNST